MSISYRWIKLYIEILDDPKMGLLPNHLWRRTIEFFLMAGECGKGGTLGSVTEIAWRLRVDKDDLLQALRSLEEIGIVHCTQENTWVVSKFAERQAAEPPKERTEAYRKREYQRGSNEPVTTRYTEKNREEIDKNREESVQQLAERLTGLMMTPADIPTLKAWEQDGITEDDIRDALQWRVDNGRPPAKTIHQLEAGVKTSYSKRVQGSNARSNGRGSPAPRVYTVPEQDDEPEDPPPVTITPAGELWARVLMVIQPEMALTFYRENISTLVPARMDDGHLWLIARDDHHRQLVVSRADTTIRKALLGVANHAVQVVYEVAQ